MEEKRVNPNNFIDTKKYIKRDKTILPLYLLSNWLENNGCQVAIEKKPKDVRLNKFCLQQIFSRNAVEKKFTLVFDERYNEHFLNKENRQNFMSSLKMDLSNYHIYNSSLRAKKYLHCSFNLFIKLYFYIKYQFSFDVYIKIFNFFEILLK